VVKIGRGGPLVAGPLPWYTMVNPALVFTHIGIEGFESINAGTLAVPLT